MKTKFITKFAPKLTASLNSFIRLSWSLSIDTAKAHSDHLQCYATESLATLKSTGRARDRDDLEALSKGVSINFINYVHRGLATNLAIPLRYRAWFDDIYQECGFSDDVDKNNEELIFY